jgi:hypothetical protein
MSFVDPNDFEAVALDTAAQLAGAFVVENDLTDKPFAQWTPEQWAGMIEATCGGYVSSLFDQQDRVHRAVAKVTAIPMPGAEVRYAGDS